MTLQHRGYLADVEVPASLVAELRLLVTHRTDLVADRVRMVNRLRDVLSGYFPALERAFDFAHRRGAVVLLTGYQTPSALRARGHARLTAWLVKRGVRSAEQIATGALAAAQAQHTVVPAQDITASIVADLATQLLALDARIADLESRITATFRAHPQAPIIESMPGMGPVLGAELIAAAGDLKGFYLKKRGQGFKHTQALIALARRRVDVLWALLRDNRVFQITAPTPQEA